MTRSFIFGGFIKYFFIPFLLFISLNLSARAIKIPESQCSNIDIRDNMSEKMREHFSEPRNQHLLGWCSHFVMADMLTAEIGESVSPAHIAFIYNQKQKKGEAFAEGTVVYSAVDKLVKYLNEAQYICFEKSLPYGELRLYFDEMYWSFTQFSQMFELPLGDLERFNISVEGYRYERETIFEVGIAGLSYYLKYFIDSIAEDENKKRLMSKKKHKQVKRRINNTFYSYVKDYCKDEDKSFNLRNLELRAKSFIKPARFKRDGSTKFRTRNLFEIKAHFKTIGDVLKKGKPVSISYHPKYVSIKMKGDYHASVLVGRRWENGKCQFKIRNSWGKSCEIYDENKIEECNKEEGAYWVDDQTLYKMHLNIGYIK